MLPDEVFNAFVSADQAFKVDAELTYELEQAYDTYLEDPDDPGKLAHLEELEDQSAESDEWKAAGGDPEICKALDFHNDMAKDFLMYHICAHCGSYMPAHYWFQAINRWKFKCHIQWPVVCEKDPTVAATMVEKYGDNMDTWPQPGCGCKYRPWPAGPTKIIELKMPDGSWQAIVAESLPQQLVDEIKKVLFEWHDASGRVTADEILKAVPTMFPQTHATGVPGVSKLDVQDWINKGEPTLTQSGWVALCEVIARENVKDLGIISKLCHKMAACDI
jgi:hypothetical protein